MKQGICLGGKKLGRRLQSTPDPKYFSTGPSADLTVLYLIPMSFFRTDLHCRFPGEKKKEKKKQIYVFLKDSDLWKDCPGNTASVPSGNLLEMHLLRPPRPTKSKTGGAWGEL